MGLRDWFSKIGEKARGAGETAGSAASAPKAAAGWARSKYGEYSKGYGGIGGAAIAGAGVGWAGAKMGGRGLKAVGQSFIPFLVLALFFHLFDWGTGFARGSITRFWADPMLWLQIGFALILFVLFYLDWDLFRTGPVAGIMDNFFKFLPLVGIALIVYFLPSINQLVPVLGGVRGMNIILNPMIHPVWLYFGLLTFQDSRIARIIFVGLFVLWAGYVIFGFVLQGDNFGRATITPGDYQNFIEFFKQWWIGAKNFWIMMSTGVWTGLKVAYNQTVYQATGGDLFYTGQVDTNANEKLGVYMGELEPSSPEFYDDEPVSVWATLEVNTLDKPVPLDISCYTYDPMANPKIARQEVDKTPGKLTPTDHFVVYRQEIEDVECFFDRLPKGMQTVGFKTDFEFQTQAYYRTYFMDINRLRSYKTENIDILKEFGITDSDPVAIYTNGPLMIGMRVKEPPVGIGQYSTGTTGDVVVDRISMRISIENVWEGKVKDITRMIIMLPKGMNIVVDDNGDMKCGEFAFEEGSCGEISEIGERCDESINNIYKLKRQSLQKQGESETATLTSTQIDKFRGISCPILISPSTVLGNNPITARYFKVLLDYNYSIEKEIQIYIEDSGTGEEQDVGSTLYSGEEKLMRFDSSINDSKYLKAYSTTEEDPNRGNEEKYSPMILDIAKNRFKVSYFFLKAVIKTESGWNVESASDTGDALGLMMIKGSDARSHNCGDGYEKPELNIPCGARIIDELMTEMKSKKIPVNTKNVAAAYKKGIGAVAKSELCKDMLKYQCESETAYAGTNEYSNYVDTEFNRLRQGATS